VKPPRSLALVWFLSFLICALGVAVAFSQFDVLVARRVYGILGHVQALATGFGSAVLLSGEASVVLVLVVSRITHGHLSPFREVTALACLTSICAYAINAGVLKLLFGVPTPAEVLLGTRHAFNFLNGSFNSSFPSGHMVLAGAFAGVFMRLYRGSVALFSALLALGAFLLILGDWHFVSDVMAGTFVGVSAGLLAGELWLAHSR
jgi:membrane-associated phospholipid phosphatase